MQYSEKIGAHIPKKGRRNAMTTVDATRPVLSMTAKIVSFKNPSGRNSSKLRANGFNNKANLFVVKDATIPYRVRHSENQHNHKHLSIREFYNKNPKGYLVKGLIT
jgi:hypothetical protein